MSNSSAVQENKVVVMARYFWGGATPISHGAPAKLPYTASIPNTLAPRSRVDFGPKRGGRIKIGGATAA